MKRSDVLKEQLAEVRRKVLEDIKEILRRVSDNELDVSDNRGSLIVNSGSDDAEENVVIQRVWLKYSNNGGIPIAACGVFDEDYEVEVDTFTTEFLMNILEACETAEEEL
jgi:hypothetical protein